MMTTELPAGLTSLGKGAFAGCSSLTSIALPALGLTSLSCLEPAVNRVGCYCEDAGLKLIAAHLCDFTADVQSSYL